MSEAIQILRNRYINVLEGLKKNKKPTDFDTGCRTVAEDFIRMLDETVRDSKRVHQDKT